MPDLLGSMGNPHCCCGCGLLLMGLGIFVVAAVLDLWGYLLVLCLRSLTYAVDLWVWSLYGTAVPDLWGIYGESTLLLRLRSCTYGVLYCCCGRGLGPLGLSTVVVVAAVSNLRV